MESNNGKFPSQNSTTVLENWCKYQCNKFRNKQLGKSTKILSQYELDKFNSIKFPFPTKEPIKKKSLDEMFIELQEYVKSNNGKFPRKSNENRLSRWCNNIGSKFNNIKNG